MPKGRGRPSIPQSQKGSVWPSSKAAGAGIAVLTVVTPEAQVKKAARSFKRQGKAALRNGQTQTELAAAGGLQQNVVEQPVGLAVVEHDQKVRVVVVLDLGVVGTLDAIAGEV